MEQLILHRCILIIRKKMSLFLEKDQHEDCNTRGWIFYKFCKIRKKILFKFTLQWKWQFFLCNATKIYQFKAKYSEIKPCPLRLGNISKDFIGDDMKGKIDRFVYDISVDCNAFDISDSINIHKYEKAWCKLMFRFF